MVTIQSNNGFIHQLDTSKSSTLKELNSIAQIFLEPIILPFSNDIIDCLLSENQTIDINDPQKIIELLKLIDYLNMHDHYLCIYKRFTTDAMKEALQLSNDKYPTYYITNIL